jgi:hypothetical protein
LTIFSYPGGIATMLEQMMGKHEPRRGSTNSINIFNHAKKEIIYINISSNYPYSDVTN